MREKTESHLDKQQTYDLSTRKNIDFSTITKINYYLKSFIFKVLLLWFEVDAPRVKLFIYEFIYSLSNFVNSKYIFRWPFKTDIIKTKFGIFKIRPHTIDAIYASPAYERIDINYLFKTIDKLKAKNKLLFIDIGANLGKYTIMIARRFKDNKNIKIMAFEPTLSIYTLLKKNIAMNGVPENIELYNLACFSKESRDDNISIKWEQYGKSLRKAITLDALVLRKLIDYDVVVLKIDTDGLEIEILEGAKELINSGKEIFILLEDALDPKVAQYLNSKGIEFLAKFTPLNSWWHKDCCND
ncbi:MAG: FkbM family methyltransferase [Candidatus Firestonebacteria bacterium]